MPDPVRQSIYVVECMNGMLKIGVSLNPLRRASCVHQHSPVPCRLIATWLGDFKDEKALHWEFRAHRSHCEWFRIEGALAEFVERNRGRGVARVSEWPEITFACNDERKAALSARLTAMSKARWADPAFRRRQWVERRTQRHMNNLPADDRRAIFADGGWRAAWADAEARFGAEYDARPTTPAPELAS